MQGTHALVTGGTGFLGQHLVHRLAAAEGEITILSRTPVQGVRVLHADLTESDLDLSSHVYTTVYHVAGLAHRVPQTAAENERFFQINAEGTKNLLCALERARELPEAIVLISTVAVYGVEEGTLLVEATPRNATDPYGASKRDAEDILLEWCVRRKVRAAVARLPLLAGKRAPGNFGAMLYALAQGRYVGVGSSTARRSMVMVDDVAHILPKMAEVGGVFHLTDGYHPSFAELEQALAAALHRKAPKRLPLGLAKLGGRIGDGLQNLTGRKMPFNTKILRKMTSTLTFSDERARRVLNWRPSKVLDHMAELVACYSPRASSRFWYHWLSLGRR